MKPLTADLDVIIADGGSTDDGVEPENLRACGVRALLRQPLRLAELELALASLCEGT